MISTERSPSKLEHASQPNLIDIHHHRLCNGAAPTGCSYGVIPTLSGTHAYCSGGDGSYRAVANCNYGGWYYNVYGDWTLPANVMSLAYCNGGVASSAGIEKRNDSAP